VETGDKARLLKGIFEGMGVGHGGWTHNKKALCMLHHPFKIHRQSSFVRNALKELGNSTMFVVRIPFNFAAFGIRY